MRMLRRLIGVLILGVVMLAMVQVVGADSIADHVVISEILIEGSGGEEFVELYNPTESEVDMSSWYWCYFSSSSDWNSSTNHPQFPSGAKIFPHRFYLIGLKGYPMPTSNWQPYSTARLSNLAGSVGIFPWDPDTKTAEDAESGRIDAVAWGTVSHVKEGTEADVPTPSKSLQRRVNDTITENGYGPGWDSNDNSADFFIQDSPDPQNSGADPLPPVPELSTLLLLSIGLIALAGYVLLTKRRD